MCISFLHAQLLPYKYIAQVWLIQCMPKINLCIGRILSVVAMYSNKKWRSNKIVKPHSRKIQTYLYGLSSFCGQHCPFESNNLSLLHKCQSSYWNFTHHNPKVLFLTFLHLPCLFKYTRDKAWFVLGIVRITVDSHTLVTVGALGSWVLLARSRWAHRLSWTLWSTSGITL